MAATPRELTLQGDENDITTLKKVYILPTTIPATLKSQWLTTMYESFYRLMFLTKRKVWMKTTKTKKELRIILVPSPHPLSECDKMWLKKKGFRIKAKGCDRDSCFTCRQGLTLKSI